jgi:cytochrome c oxidase subunit 2
MNSKYIPFFPEQASTIAPNVDALYAFLVLVTAFFSLGIAVAIVYFAVKYRRRSEDHIPGPVHGGLLLEITWSGIPLILSMIMFAWGAAIFFQESKPPADSMEIYVTGKQWMWKLQHMEGQREMNELHIPVNRNIKLTLTSEDVLHDFFVPAFRTKTDVVPGKYTTEWFRATKVGAYHIFCAEYCGTRHSNMIGTVYVMEPADYANWLSSGGAQGSMAQRGEQLFQQFGCVNCHQTDGQGRCPNLVGLYGKPVRTNHGIVTADSSYVRESILTPGAKIVEGYENIMPTFQGIVSEEGLQQLIEYVKSIAPTAADNTRVQPGGAAGGGHSLPPGRVDPDVKGRETPPNR